MRRYKFMLFNYVPCSDEWNKYREGILITDDAGEPIKCGEEYKYKWGEKTVEGFDNFTILLDSVKKAKERNPERYFGALEQEKEITTDALGFDYLTEKYITVGCEGDRMFFEPC